MQSPHNCVSLHWTRLHQRKVLKESPLQTGVSYTSGALWAPVTFPISLRGWAGVGWPHSSPERCEARGGQTAHCAPARVSVQQEGRGVSKAATFEGQSGHLRACGLHVCEVGKDWVGEDLQTVSFCWGLMSTSTFLYRKEKWTNQLDVCVCVSWIRHLYSQMSIIIFLQHLLVKKIISLWYLFYNLQQILNTNYLSL